VTSTAHPALAGYAAAGGWDEAVAPGGEVRPVARAAIDAVGAHDLRALVHEETRAAGMSFAMDGRESEFVVDPVPRVMAADEWAALGRGLEQRLRALDAFVADVHGPQRMIADGVMPARVLGGAEHYEPELAGLRPPGRRWIGEDRANTELGRLLLPAMRRGTLGVINAFGTGVADDKLAQAYVEDMIRFYLGEQPCLRSVPTYDLARPRALKEALDRFDELVVKPFDAGALVVNSSANGGGKDTWVVAA
jgi:uncharacterized circularly permuted ATP-grasp superfamily protein